MKNIKSTIQIIGLIAIAIPIAIIWVTTAVLVNSDGN